MKGESAGARTRDPNIKSVVLYLLSYGFIVPNRSISVFGGANVDNIFIIAKFILSLLRILPFLSYRMRSSERTKASSFAMPRIAKTVKIIAIIGNIDTSSSEKMPLLTSDTTS